MADAGRLGRDRGSATVLVLAVGLVTILIGLASAAVGAAIVARHRAQTAADLAALAGAALALPGEPVACERARAIAVANGARLVSCALDGWDVIVTAEVAGVVSFAGPASASARAGPVDDPAVPSLSLTASIEKG